jgi:DNA-binding transcriptional LysR family regulator
MHGLKSVIQHSRRVTLMPTHAFGLEAAQGVLRGIPLKGPTSSRHLHILSLEHIPPSPLAQVFVDHLVAVAADLRTGG